MCILSVLVDHRLREKKSLEMTENIVMSITGVQRLATLLHAQQREEKKSVENCAGCSYTQTNTNSHNCRADHIAFISHMCVVCA